MCDTRARIQLAEPVAEQVLAEQRLGGDHRLRVCDGTLEIEKAGGELKSQIDAVELAGGEPHAGEGRIAAAAAVDSAGHVTDRLGGSMIEEQPTRQLRSARDDLVDQWPQLVLAFGGDNQSMSPTRARPEFPHEARLNALQMLLHPCGEIPLNLVVEEAIQLVGFPTKRFPPVFDAGDDVLARMILDGIFTGRDKLPAHGSDLGSTRDAGWCTNRAIGRLLSSAGEALS